MAIPVSLAAMQAQRAAAMKWTVGSEYQQPAHTFLATVDQTKDSPELHRQVVLPGAKRAVHLEALEQFHARGLATNEIVQEINATMDVALAPRLEQFRSWRDGELSQVLDRAKEREERRVALLAARAAEIDRQVEDEAT